MLSNISVATYTGANPWDDSTTCLMTLDILWKHLVLVVQSHEKHSE